MLNCAACEKPAWKNLLRRGGKIKALGIATRTRSPLAPQLPTLAEAGYPGPEWDSWYGFVAPAKTPREIIEKLAAGVKSVLGRPEVRDKLLSVGLVPAGTTPQEFRAFLQEKMASYAKIIKEADIRERLGRRFDTYVLDVRGRVLSTGGPELQYDLTSCAKDVAEFAAALGLKRYRVLGHSLGARTGARLGRLHGELLARLVLVDPPLSGPGRRPYVKDLAYYIDAIREAQNGLTDFEVVRRSYTNWTEEQLRTRAEWLHTCDEAAIAASHRGLQDEEIHSDFPESRTPTLLLIASKGGVITEEDVSEVRKLMPAIEVEWIRHVSHMIPFDDLEPFIAVVEPFLAKE